jgi:hypothetical protein
MSQIWTACSAQAVIAPLQGTLLRLVESQAQVATGHLGLTLEEQAELEDLLEAVKPPMPEDTGGLHYLLATPFRYPPLPYGSRFGNRYEPSLFYGSQQAGTVLAESAYYRLVFWHGMEQPPAGVIRTRHTLFSADYACDQGVRLHRPPFDAYREVLTDRREYGATQALGRAMREAGVQGFEFISARDADCGLNVAVFTPAALASASPGMYQDWWAETSAGGVSFLCPREGRWLAFELDQFLVDGVFPQPSV